MLKQYLRSALNWFQKQQIIGHIRKYDFAVDHNSWVGAEFYPSYFTPFALPQPANYGSLGIFQTSTIENNVGDLAAKIASDFKSKLVGFLGKDTRLDDIYLFWFDPTKRKEWSLSNSWHDDNVGHRIKIFVCFEGNGNTPTVVIPNSYNKPYKPRVSEIGRFAGKRNVVSVENEIRLNYKSGDVAMFDTACLHRGLYEEPSAVRTVLVMEFIDRNKANTIAGKSPCGPGMSRNAKVIFKEGAYKALKGTNLLDEGLIKKIGDEYHYSLSNIAGQ